MSNKYITTFKTCVYKMFGAKRYMSWVLRTYLTNSIDFN